MTGYYRRPYAGLLLTAAVASFGALQALFALPGSSGPSMQRAGYAPPTVERGTPSPIRTSSNLAKLRDLNFLRCKRNKRAFKGVSMSVAEGKRRARKARNRRRARKQWKRWHR